MLIKQFIFVFLLTVFSTNQVFAFVSCQPKYDNDKRSLPSKRGNCGVCHINSNGSGPQNAFGNAFKNAGFMITDELVAKFPELFKQPDDANNETGNNSGAGSSGNVSEEQLLPTIVRVKPKKININVQSMLKVKGTNFAEGVKGFLDDNEAVTTFKSNMLLIIDALLDTIGIHKLHVENPDGKESNTVDIQGKEPKKK